LLPFYINCLSVSLISRHTRTPRRQPKSPHPGYSSHPTRTMANQRPHITLDELSKKVAEDIGYNIVNLFDREEMARGVLDALGHEEDEEVGETFGDYLEAKAAEGAIE
jgi:hypothetical protein